MPNLNEIGQVPDEEIPSTPVSELPEMTGGFMGTAELQTDWNTFTLPDEDGFDFDVTARDAYNNNAPVLAVRLGARRDGKTLGKHLRVKGGLYGCEITTRSKRSFGKLTNNVDLLLQALGETDIPTRPLEKAKRLVSHAGKQFRAKMSLGARFTPDKHGVDLRYANWVNDYNTKNNLPADTPYQGKERPDGTKSITHPIPKVDGKYPTELEIEVNGQTVSARVWPDFDQFGKASNGAA